MLEAIMLQNAYKCSKMQPQSEKNLKIFGSRPVSPSGRYQVKGDALLGRLLLHPSHQVMRVESVDTTDSDQLRDVDPDLAGFVFVDRLSAATDSLSSRRLGQASTASRLPQFLHQLAVSRVVDSLGHVTSRGIKSATMAQLHVITHKFRQHLSLCAVDWAQNARACGETAHALNSW